MRIIRAAAVWVVALQLNAVLNAIFSFAEENRFRPSSSSMSGDLGLGLMLGQPNGITLKYWTSSTHALNFGLTYAFGNSLGFIGDYLWHFPHAFSSATHGQVSNEFVPYLGVGGVVSVSTVANPSNRSSIFGNTAGSGFSLGVRVPLGIEFLPKSLPLGVFLELDPGLGLIPGAFGFLQADVGIRFYF